MTVTLEAMSEQAAYLYARLLLQLDALMVQGKGNTKEADVIREQMDRPWHAMSDEEQDRLSGLSEDLYAIAEDGPRQVAMTPAERSAYGHQAMVAYAQRDWDATLRLLRHPPLDIPTDAIAFMQARMWEHLGTPEVALIFMRHAAHLNPTMHTVSVMTLLGELGQHAEELECAENAIGNPHTEAESLYLAAGVLLRTARKKALSESKPTLDRIIKILRKALQQTLSTSRMKREVPDLDSYIVCMLGACYEHLGNHEEALRVYSEALVRNPLDYEVAAFRGLLLYHQNLTRALGDFQVAVEGRVRAPWPYYFLARHALVIGRYELAWRLSIAGLESPDLNDKARAQLHEFLAIAMAILNQSLEKVNFNFAQALRWDPDNKRIQQNREKVLGKSRSTGTASQAPWGFSPSATEAEVEMIQHSSFLRISAQQGLASSQRNNAAERPLFPTAA